MVVTWPVGWAGRPFFLRSDRSKSRKAWDYRDQTPQIDTWLVNTTNITHLTHVVARATLTLAVHNSAVLGCSIHRSQPPTAHPPHHCSRPTTLRRTVLDLHHLCPNSAVPVAHSQETNKITSILRLESRNVCHVHLPPSPLCPHNVTQPIAISIQHTLVLFVALKNTGLVLVGPNRIESSTSMFAPKTTGFSYQTPQRQRSRSLAMDWFLVSFHQPSHRIRLYVERDSIFIAAHPCLLECFRRFTIEHGIGIIFIVCRRRFIVRTKPLFHALEIHLSLHSQTPSPSNIAKKRVGFLLLLLVVVGLCWLLQ